jgi:hypothetical protein
MEFRGMQKQIACFATSCAIHLIMSPPCSLPSLRHVVSLRSAGKAAGAVIGALAGAYLGIQLKERRSSAAIIELFNILVTLGNPALLTREMVLAVEAKYGTSLLESAPEELKSLYGTVVEAVIPPGGQRTGRRRVERGVVQDAPEQGAQRPHEHAHLRTHSLMSPHFPIQSHLPFHAGDAPLRGTEPQLIINFKAALGLDDNAAAPVHLDVGRRLLRGRLEAGNSAETLLARKVGLWVEVGV